MMQRTFGKTDVRVAVIGQGTWRLENADRAQAIAALRRGFDLGMTHVDTAERYGGGAVEEVVGEAIAGRRAEVFLVSKVAPDNASRQGTVQACERSLRRLRVDSLDCYLLHWPSHHPLAETIAGFQQLARDGKIKSWGVSNFDEKALDEAVRLGGPGCVACNQVRYHLRDRAVEHSVLPRCEELGVTVVGYSPFGQGRFGSHRELDEIARARGATPRQIALAFLIRHPLTFAIPKAAQIAHVEENAGAGELRLTDGEIGRIDAAFSAGRGGD